MLCILKSLGNLLVLSIIQASALKWNISRPVNIELLALKNICPKFTSLRHRQSGRLNMERGGGKKGDEALINALYSCLLSYHTKTFLNEW